MTGYYCPLSDHTCREEKCVMWEGACGLALIRHELWCIDRSLGELAHIAAHTESTALNVGEVAEVIANAD